MTCYFERARGNGKPYLVICPGDADEGLQLGSWLGAERVTAYIRVGFDSPEIGKIFIEIPEPVR